MLKFGGFFFDYDQICELASSIVKREMKESCGATSVHICEIENRSAKIVYPVREGRGCSDRGVLLVSHMYNKSKEDIHHYSEVQCTKRDTQMLAFLRLHGLEPNLMLSQWMTLPEP
ncbi:hypothetical protein DFH11DRAFT_1594174 [Phellopilus nigrolimitatus]|nr:hypothetical protein DFH11DRAFT_1594174 [Phellopilus nigrolimitatus]